VIGWTGIRDHDHRNAEHFLVSGPAPKTRTGDEALIAATVSKKSIGLTRVHGRRAMGIESGVVSSNWVKRGGNRSTRGACDGGRGDGRSRTSGERLDP
jgi:hypothetical protein